MYDRRHRAYLGFIVGYFVFCYFGSLLVPRFQPLILIGGFAVLALIYGISLSEDRRRREAIQRTGVELEAEILEHYDAGVPSRAPANAPRPLRSAEDPMELELRYKLGDREIVSRGRVSTKTYFHTRGLKTLKIRVSPEQPEDWIEVA